MPSLRLGLGTQHIRPLFRGLLDKFNGSAAAYSLRKLSASTTNVVRVRRASDNDEKDFTASQIESGEMVNWVNSQTVPPLDIGVETPDGRIPVPEGGTSIGTPAAAYSLRNLSTTYTGNVVDVRRNDGTEESFTAAEVSDGTLVDWVLAPVSSLIGNGMYFDGVDDNVTTTANAALSAASGDFFVEFNFLVPVSNPSGVQILVEKGGQSNTVYDYTLRLNASGAIFGGIQKSATGAFSNVPVYSNLISDFGGEVVTVKLALESGTEKIYINGVRKDDTTISPGGNPATSDLSIGSSFAGGNYYAGLIYSVNINDQVAYQGYGNTNADWEDTIGSNDGTVNGSPELFTGQGINGTVSKWYDQSGNTNHAVQTTPANQPTIVEGGSLVTGGIDFDGTDDYLSVNSVASALSGNDNNIDSFAVAKNESSSGASVIFGLGNTTDPSSQLHYFGGIGTAYRIISRDDGNVISIADGGTFSSESLLSVSDNGNEIEIRVNGTSVATDTDDKGQRTFDTATVGAWGREGIVGTFFDGTIKELIIYPSDQSDNRTAIEANIGETYGITGIPAYDNTVDGFVETWYDQSGNGRDATQSVAGNQPKIVDGGALIAVNGHPSINFTSGLWLDFDNTSMDIRNSASYTTGQMLGTASGASAIAYSSFNDRYYIPYSNGTKFFFGYGSTTAAIDLGNVNTNPFLITTDVLSNSPSAWINSVQGSGTATASSAVVDVTGELGANIAGLNTNAKICETVLYYTSQSANRTAIEGNINAHYSIYA